MNDAELEKMAEQATRHPTDGSWTTNPRDAFIAGYKKAREWIKTSERRPPLGDYHKCVLTYSIEGAQRVTMVGWIHNHPDGYPFWQKLPDRPEGVE